MKPTWVQLDAICVRASAAPINTVADGLDMTGEVRGLLSGWWRTVKGDWLGVVNYTIPYADGRRHRLELRDQLVPLYALRKRDDTRRPNAERVGHRVQGERINLDKLARTEFRP